MDISTIYELSTSLPAFFSILDFWFGAVIVSYFGVVVDRGWKESISGRSHCDHCKKTIAPQYMVPIFSYLYLLAFNKGRSNCCGKPLSIEYFLSEIFGGIWGVLLWLHIYQFEFSLSLVLLVIVSMIFLFLAIYDMWKYEIDIVPLGVMLLLVIISFIVDPSHSKELYNYDFLSLTTLAVGLIASLIVVLLIVISKGKGLGVGDVFVVAFIVMSLGWEQSLVGLQVTIYVAAIFGLIIARIKNKFHGLIIPLVPFLMFGWMIALVYGQQIIDVYLNFTTGLYY
jgi:leader peptidase (prepilin peptidase) / N-methyltransferase